MKKILATLLVATMLLSCMCVVSFAADTTLKTQATFPYAAMDEDNGKTGNRWSLTDAAALVLYNDYYEGEGNGVQAYYDANGTYMGYVPQVGDYVTIPYYVDTTVTGLTWFRSTLKYNQDLFEYVKFQASEGWTGSVPTVGATDGIMKFGAVGTADVAVESDSSLFVLVFKIKDMTDCDTDVTDGKTTAEFVFSDADVVPAGGEQVAADISTATLTMEVAGLTPGEEEEKDPTPITQTEVDAMTAVATTATIAEGSTLSSVLGANIVSDNGETDISKATAYSAVFATIDLTGKDTEDVEFGFILRAKDGNGADRFFKAEKEYGGKYGVAFFGTSEVLGWYKAVPAVKLADGTILENAGAAQEL